MYSPKPPPPMKAAKVALAITSTAAVRTPPNTTGSASGQVTRKRTWRGLMPSPRAASIEAADTPRSATSVLMTIGGIARKTSATSAGRKPIPKIWLHERQHRKAREHARHVDAGERYVAQKRGAGDKTAERYAERKRARERCARQHEVIADVQHEVVHRRRPVDFRAALPKTPEMIVQSEPGVSGEREASSLPAASPLDDPALYFSRELSWLEFNDRVLEEAIDERNPLLERLKFMAIYGTNLDEYFMIRVAALKQQIAAEVHKRANDGRLPAEQLAAVSERLRESLARFRALLCKEILPALAREGIAIRRYEELGAGQRSALERFFEDRVFPVLTPLAVDQGHPFPYISNLSLSLGVEMYELTDDGPRMHFARVKVPPSLPRLVPLEAFEGEHQYVTLEDVIAHNLGALFPGMDVRASYCFRVTRDADLDLQEDEADDLLRAIESELRRRRFGEPVRLEVEASMPEHLRGMLLEALSLTEVDLYEIDGLLGWSDLMTLANLDRPDLHDAPFTPAIPKRLVGEGDIFAAIREGDLLLHHPYDSFDPVVQFVAAAANDPRVLAIKQTLYRTSGNSPIVGSLVDAVENGKQVAALIELKARFDEENNIQWARNLERVGAHVVYGFPAMKVHAKVILVVRDEPDGIRRYVHFGTGNYNDKTARIYTDLSLFTCRPELGRDVTQSVQSADRVFEVDPLRRVARRADELTQRLSRSDRPRNRARLGRPAQRHRRQAQCDQRRRHRTRALPRIASRRSDRSAWCAACASCGPALPESARRSASAASSGASSNTHASFASRTAATATSTSAAPIGWAVTSTAASKRSFPYWTRCCATTSCVTSSTVYAQDDCKTRWLRSDGTYVRRRPEHGEPAHCAQKMLLEAAQALSTQKVA